jgi:hypothetical protein
MAICIVTASAFGVTLAQEMFTFDRVSHYIDETKILHLLGEVRNHSDSPVSAVLVSAQFHDSEGNFLGEFRRPAEIHTLGPGESSPFEILFLDQEASHSVWNYTLSAKSTPAAEPKEKGLEIISSASRLDLLGTLYINAAARNGGNETATNTIMIATLYDKDGRVIAVGRALAEAVRGTSDVPSGSNAAFGIAITERLQTYNAVQYSLLVQSDQYASEPGLFKVSSQATRPGNENQSGCLIATAAFGSELAPQVQQLRSFREDIVLPTFAGSSFMSAFNSWYYAFSPSVAEYERQSPWARDAVRVAIQPLLTILAASASLNGWLASAGVDPEISVIFAGMSASTLLGLLYLSPAVILIGLRKRPLFDSPILKIILATAWLLSFSMIGISFALELCEVMAIGTSLLVLCCIATAVLSPSDGLARWKIGRSFQNQLSV